MRQVAKWIGSVFLVLSILTLLLFFVGPRLLGISFFTIYSGSMDPSIPIGSVAAVYPTEASSIQVGDIIAYSSPTEADKVIVHRVVEVITNGGLVSFRTAGDGNSIADGYMVPTNNIVGRVWFHLPFLGYFAYFVKTVPGFILVVGIPAIIIVSLEVRDIIANVNRKRQGISHQPQQEMVTKPSPLMTTVKEQTVIETGTEAEATRIVREILTRTRTLAEQKSSVNQCQKQ